jgi:hypothetical protein
MGAAKITAYSCNGIGKRTRQQMKKRLLFYRVYVLAYYLAIYQAVKHPILVFPYLTDTPFAIFYMAAVTAEKTFDGLFFLIQYLLKVCNLHIKLHTVFV